MLFFVQYINNYFRNRIIKKIHILNKLAYCIELYTISQTKTSDINKKFLANVNKINVKISYFLSFRVYLQLVMQFLCIYLIYSY